ncbi:restriction endonuclease subunit M [Baekduia soli]|uniref:site-specific DNA-methyltransferase (adenine-specific) n=1 Tax=Baekduia soli TaxID=496014 RepID=A0A5B8U2N9_9ACTN|nr:restriction endonuclease subunit M [Baekduia soli]QEC47297.1 restriction endonuclease subunit M [Baekduia soli]
MSFPSITNNQEFFSDHYLEAIIATDLKGLRADWDAREQLDEQTSRRGVRSLRAPFAKLKLDAETAEVGRDLEPLRALHDAVLTSLGFKPARHAIETTRGEVVPVALPVAHDTTLPTGLRLVALEALYATSPDEALGADSRLVEPLILDGAEIAEPTKAISLAFTVDDPPRHILLLAGATLVLCARDSWPEGRFLAVDLDLALGRNDVRPKGELDTIAALFSRDALVPGETGEAIIDELGTSSLKQAIGVSEDLREGVRRSIEDVANEIVTQRLAKNLRIYNEPDVARRLTRESLRFLYRILFLLYAEARPDLGIVPSLGEGYRDGYGLDRLRELALTELTTDHANDGTHLHDSLDILFELVNDGYHYEFAQQQFTEPGDAIDDTGLIFEPLNSELFGPNATPLLDSIRVRNEVVQRILARLLLTEEKGGRERRFVSYATLGINQLGAVYEGLMAYTGFLADEDLHEVRKPGSEEKHGTWVVPVGMSDKYDDDVFVTEIGEDGVSRRVTHKKGSFVYRLSGRDRQRSASYYTPEVLTRCVVKHALEELLDQNGQTTSADAVLDLTICEPALGSGAFLNEAINQLSAEYLARKQTELEDTIDPEKYATELQKVKTHFALHQSYGVDLNATAVELAEVSLWLNAMHPGLRAPWFGLHLRRGNSLIGARRAVYSGAQLEGRKWLKAIPEDRALAADALASGEVHHFLLPAEGWGAVAGTREAQELRADAVETLKQWHKGVTDKLSENDIARYAALAGRVEALWELATVRLKLAEQDLRRPLALYPDTKAGEGGGRTTRAALEVSLGDENTPLARLRLAMDAWCAMWFWPLEPTGEISPPTRTEWLSALEGLLGIDPADHAVARPAQIDLFADLDALEAREAELAAGLLMPTVDQVRQQHSWLGIACDIASREGFFHWELEFAPVFQRGGFDLQVGNPPWVRPEWNDIDALAEFDPWFGLTNRPAADVIKQRRGLTLAVEEDRRAYLEEVASVEATATFLSDPPLSPLTVGLHNNLFLGFLVAAWRHQRASGISGLVHPSGFFFDPHGARLRAAAYERIRRFWHFNNGDKLFEEIGNTRPYALMVYGDAGPVGFRFIANARVPSTVDLSLVHDGEGEPPGMKTAEGDPDRRPHSARVIHVDEGVIRSWAELFSEESDALDARLVLPYTIDDLEVLATLARSPSRLGQHHFWLSRGLDETGAVRDGDIVRTSTSPASWHEAILQGPHIHVSLPFYKEPNVPCRNHRDYTATDLESLPATHVPRTNFALVGHKSTVSLAEDWDGRPSTERYRCCFSRRVDPLGERTLQAALIPPGPLHVDVCNSLVGRDDAWTVRIVGLWSSLPLDFLVKASGKDNVRGELIRPFPLPTDDALFRPLMARTLRLNCLTADFGEIWADLFAEANFAQDAWTSDDARLPTFEDASRSWSVNTPLRMAYARRHALVELDALSALLLGLSADQLCGIYRTTFGVLRKYEHLMRYDQSGREVPRDVWRAYAADPDGTSVGRFDPPFTKPDREADMRRAYVVFAERYGGGVE